MTALNEAITTEEPEKIKEALERLKNSQMEIGKAIYSNQSAQDDQQTEEQPSEEPKDEKKDEKKE